MRKPLARLLVAALLTASAVLTVTVLVPAPTALAIAGPGVCSYYSDATFTTVVGARGTACCGEVVNWGVTTAYRRCHVVYCTDVLCPIFE